MPHRAVQAAAAARIGTCDNAAMDLPYVGVRHLHVAAVTLSLTLFVVRAVWRARAPERLAQRWVKVLPHVVDTVLLLSGVWLAWQLGGAGVRGWLPAKLIALVAYVVLGSLALRRSAPRGVSIAAAVAAVATFGYIVSVAITKSPWSVLAG